MPKTRSRARGTARRRQNRPAKSVCSIRSSRRAGLARTPPPRSGART